MASKTKTVAVISNLGRFQSDVERLAQRGNLLLYALIHEHSPELIQEAVEEKFNDSKKAHAFVDNLPDFDNDYQGWYSEAVALMKQLLPDRFSDFVRHYEKPKGRKEVNFETYRIEDCLQGLTTKDYLDRRIVGPEAAIPHVRQQVAIVKAAQMRIKSSLFDIRQLVQADLFDSELDAAKELVKSGFLRAAGIVAGVVIEKHLAQVCENHNLIIRKKHPAISDFNDALKKADVLEVSVWRQVQRFGDIRNLCGHNKEREPARDEVGDLIDGADKLCKTLF